jgi:sugar/nucleoside kinase (ribokinase family)
MATAMAGCAALGLRAAFLGPTGNDPHGALVRAELERRGVDLSLSPIADGPQACSIILLAEGHAERIVLWSRGGSCKFLPVEYSRLRLLHVDDVYLDAAIDAASAARKAGCLVTTDIDQVTERTPELISLATHPILAEHVPEALTGRTGLEPALRALRAHTAAPIVVTRGPRGAAALDGDAYVEVDGFAVEAVDTTGAGDVFRSGFIAALLQGRPLGEVLRYGNAAAAISCTRRGAMASVPARHDVDAFLRQA